jgi:hypothetical protein
MYQSDDDEATESDFEQKAKDNDQVKDLAKAMHNKENTKLLASSSVAQGTLSVSSAQECECHVCGRPCEGVKSSKGSKSDRATAKKKRRMKALEEGELSLLCQECFFCYHLSCLSPQEILPVSRGNDWYCPHCLPRHILGTAWVPLCDIPFSNSVLAIMPTTSTVPGIDCRRIPHSHRKQQSGRHTVSDNEVPRAYFDREIMKDKCWHTTEFHLGDVVLFDSRTVSFPPQLNIDRIRCYCFISFMERAKIMKIIFD